MGVIEECKPPLIIRIPDNVIIDGDAVYLGDFIIGIITPLCPAGFMETHGLSMYCPK
jgi:hypothetical protein